MDYIAEIFARSDLTGLSSDEVLARARPALEAEGWQIEKGKRAADKIVRGGWELDGWHPEHRAMLEVEGGRATESNAVHRNIVRAIALDVRHLILVVPEQYRHSNGVARSADITRDLAARLKGRLAFEITVVGY